MILLEALMAYRKKHGVSPNRICVTPLAALSLAESGELPRYMDGVPVVTREFHDSDVTTNGVDLAVFVKVRGKDYELAVTELKQSISV